MIDLNVKAQESKIRISVSPTLRKMMDERNQLFTNLRKLCQAQRIELTEQEKIDD